MKNLSFKLNIIYLILISLTPFIRSYGAIDVIGPQFLWLSLVNLLYFFPFLKFSINRIFNLPILFFFLYIIVCFLSFFYSSNLPESQVEFIRLFVLFITLFFTSNIFVQISNQSLNRYLFYFIIFLSLIESSISLSYFFSYYNFGDTIVRSREYAGLAYNVNIGAFSLLLKLPFLLYFFFNSPKKRSTIFLGVLSFMSIFNIFLTGSRGGFIALLLIFSYFLFLTFLKKDFKKVFYVLSFISISLLTNFYLFKDNSNSVNVLERVVDINNDSTKSRLRFYLVSLKETFTKPFIGKGLGTYKSESLKFEKDYTEGYSVPYNNHNDILQSGFELGIAGFFLYLFFILSIFYLLKDWFKSPLFSSLLLSSLTFLIDSNLNFPIHRPIIMIQVFFLISYIATKRSKILRIKYHAFFILAAISCISVFALLKINKSLRIQNILTSSFNEKIFNPKYFDRINDLDINFPNISVTSLPIGSLVSYFYLNNDSLELAKNLAFQSQKINPYIGFNDHTLSQIYLKENNVDSALFYAKRAFFSFPNTTHSTSLQQIFEISRDYKSLDSAFAQVKDRNFVIEWENYLAIYGSNKFDYDTIVYKRAKEALKLFPNSKTISRYANFILKDESSLQKAFILDTDALRLYEQKNYKEALKLWLDASKILPDEEGYIDNIIKCYFALSNFELVIEQIQNLGLDFKNTYPKYYYYLGVAYLSTNISDKACTYFYKGATLDNQDSKKMYNKTCN